MFGYSNYYWIMEKIIDYIESEGGFEMFRQPISGTRMTIHIYALHGEAVIVERWAEGGCLVYPLARSHDADGVISELAARYHD